MNWVEAENEIEIIANGEFYSMERKKTAYHRINGERETKNEYMAIIIIDVEDQNNNKWSTGDSWESVIEKLKNFKKRVELENNN